ncbi:hypothetical protein D9758_013251 [Tetrapyrgos nigripes]|uniref:Ubiquilin n=1 Tax=Tetrapyrgos nigripes TaxID=182062 RepID=A0A8H5CN84_9AGAR|nr:hypothetical protein D9758_013251 [Tetrapyrgos nigripes]
MFNTYFSTTSKMSDEGASNANEIQINIKGPNELKLQISISLDKTVSELKQLIATKSDVEAERQRLIYSGRVLKDDDLLSNYKIQSSHTIHMVKGAAKSNPSSSSSGAGGPSAPPLPTMQTGQNVHDPLTALNGHQGFGLMAGFNPFADMGLNPADPNMLQTMMSSPEFLQQMSSLMSNPAIMEQIIQSNPQLQSMAPQARQMFQSEQFRNMMSNPESLRAIMQMQQMFGQAGLGGGGMGGMGGLGGFGGLGGNTAFPAPGVPGSGAAAGAGAGSTTSTQTPSSGTTSPGANAGTGAGAGAAGANANPLGGLFSNPALLAQMQQMMAGGAGSPGAAPGSPGAGAGAGAGAGTGVNPWAALGGMGMGGLGGLGGMGGMGGFGSPPPPADTRPPEERFQVQLQQLNDMGFTNASQNVRALLATGGNVHSAIEYILSGGGL